MEGHRSHAGPGQERQCEGRHHRQPEERSSAGVGRREIVGRMRARRTLCALLLVMTAACSSPQKDAAMPEDPVQVTEKWRAKHETDYRREWVSIAGLLPLKAGANSAGSAATNDIVLPAS